MTSDANPGKKSGADAAAGSGGKKRGKNAKGAGKGNDKTVSFGGASTAQPIQSAPAAGASPVAGPAKATSGVATPASAAPDAASAGPANSAVASTSGEAAGPPEAGSSSEEVASSSAEPAEVTDEEKMAIAKAGYKRLCSDATLQTKKDGYFRTYDSQVLQSIPEEQFDEFKKLTTDMERIFFVWNVPTVHSTVTVKPFSRKKSATHAEREKDHGNRQFKEKKYRLAVCSYSQTVVRAPHPGDPEAGDLLSVGYANRSAALLHMEEYRLCLQDIQASLDAGYPTRLRYKLLDRRATCQLKLGEVSAARETLKELAESLKEADLDAKKREVWEKDVQKKAQSAAKMQDFKPITSLLQEGDDLPSLESRSEHFLSASAAVDVAYTPGEGRYAVAAQDVKPGDLLVVEKPHASVLMAEKMATHCVHCMKRVLVAFPCRECSGVMFCSPACAAAAEPYHRWECSIQDVLQASGMSPLCHLALRIVTKHGLEFFRKLRPELEKAREPGARPSTDAAGQQYDPTNYLSVYQLVTLSELRKPEDFFHRTLMAVLLLKHLRVTGFFGTVPEEDTMAAPLSSDELLVGSLLLHHLQLLQFNAHEVGEYVMMEPGQFKQSRSVYIGVAVYPTVSFFNHSCEGGVSRCFVGDTLVVRSVQPVAAGQPIFENYGPVYSHKARKDRQHWLSSRYWFDCRCVACEENWPDYDQYDIYKLLLRCGGCGAGIENDATGKDPVGDCPKCGKKNNAVELFRQLGCAQENYHSAMNMMHEGEPKKALRLFYRFIEQCQELVVRPNRDLTLCQEAARMCLAAQGSLHYIRQKKTAV